MAKDHPPAPGMRKFGFIMAEASIIITIIVTLVYVLKHPGPLSKAGFAVYSYYNWHAVLNTIGFVGFAFNAIMAFRMYPGSHTVRKGVHLLFHTIAVGMSATGVILMFKFHKANGILNLYSTHSIVGLFALITFAFQWLCGVVTFFMPCSPTWLRFMAVPMHKFMGVASMVGVCAAMVLGAMDRQRLSWEVIPVPYNSTTDKMANLYACLVLTSAFFVGFVLHKASDGVPRKPAAGAGGDDGYRSMSVERRAQQASAEDGLMRNKF